MTRAITEDEFTLYANAMVKWAGATLTTKDELEMEGIAILLDILGIEDKAHFLENKATTLGTVIYIPTAWELDRKVRVLAHEIEHVRQYNPPPDNVPEKFLDTAQAMLLQQSWASIAAQIPLSHVKLRTSGFGFAWRYLTDPRERAIYEAYAYAVGMEVEWVVSGHLTSLQSLRQHFESGYSLDGDSVKGAVGLLSQRQTSLNLIGPRSTVALKAREVLTKIDPELITHHA